MRGDVLVLLAHRPAEPSISIRHASSATRLRGDVLELEGVQRAEQADGEGPDDPSPSPTGCRPC